MGCRVACTRLKQDSIKTQKKKKKGEEEEEQKQQQEKEDDDEEKEQEEDEQEDKGDVVKSRGVQGVSRVLRFKEST